MAQTQPRLDPGAVVLVTGASGLLGRAVMAEFERRADASARIVGTVHSSAADGVRLLKVDLTDEAQTERLFDEVKPTHVVHCAAEKRPDVAERDPGVAARINAEAPRRIARLCAASGAALVYVSTDYVFDGARAAPYEPDNATNPLNVYGASKLAGEAAVQAEHATRSTVLRVPVLYGPAGRNSDSSVNVLLDTAAHATVDNVQRRYPTLTQDVARVILDICAKQVFGVFHYSAQEQWTKYQMCKLFAELRSVPELSFSPLNEIPENSVKRPGHINLSCAALAARGIDVSATDFTTWWKNQLTC